MGDYEGMAQSGSGPFPADCLSHTRADHGGAFGALRRHTPLRVEHPHVRDAGPCRQLCTYGGGGRVDGAETKGEQVGRALHDARQVSLGVVAGTLSSGIGGVRARGR